ncbi:hypothetical protein E2C01_079309 [Portunus trituberculatus]|uniref:Uncharacterized protein n=1 Tax=Portunus trituberculatus TaxID=210409 RepID=A0A5B7IV92_PORTR|nr:hypothetical protein [Portunus trituberculatus]
MAVRARLGHFPEQIFFLNTNRFHPDLSCTGFMVLKHEYLWRRKGEAPPLKACLAASLHRTFLLTLPLDTSQERLCFVGCTTGIRCRDGILKWVCEAAASLGAWLYWQGVDATVLVWLR